MTKKQRPLTPEELEEFENARRACCLVYDVKTGTTKTEEEYKQQQDEKMNDDENNPELKEEGQVVETAAQQTESSTAQLATDTVRKTPSSGRRKEKEKASKEDVSKSNLVHIAICKSTRKKFNIAKTLTGMFKNKELSTDEFLDTIVNFYMEKGQTGSVVNVWKDMKTEQDKK